MSFFIVVVVVLVVVIAIVASERVRGSSTTARYNSEPCAVADANNG